MKGKLFIDLCKKISSGKRTDKAFYLLAAAHAAMIIRDYAQSRSLLDDSKKMNLTQKLQDQWSMTNLILTINSKQAIDSDFEQQLMPSIQWLEKKAATDIEYAKFLRRLFSDVLYARYKKTPGSQSGEIYVM